MATRKKNVRKKERITAFNPKMHALKYKFTYNSDETMALHQRMNGASAITIDDLRRVSLWKSDRVLSVSSETLQKLQELSNKKDVTIDDAIVRDVLERLVDCQGIGFPMASAILKFINPCVFPIIDVRAYRALTGKKPYYATYTCDNYLDYAKAVGRIATMTKRPLRDIDEQLYCFDIEQNGKI